MPGLPKSAPFRHLVRTSDGDACWVSSSKSAVLTARLRARRSMAARALRSAIVSASTPPTAG